MGLSVSSAMEIYCQTKDLQINIKEIPPGGWGFVITRGPNGNFKTILRCYEKPFRSKKKAINTCISIMTDVCSSCREIVLNPTGLYYRMVVDQNGDMIPEEKWAVLTLNHLRWIKTELTEKGVANTWEIPEEFLRIGDSGKET